MYTAVLRSWCAAQLSGSACWGQSFGYDAWGNLQSESTTKCSAGQLSAPADFRNRLTGFGYDAAGNLTQEGSGSPSWTYSWNAEGRLTGVSGSAAATYTYDGDGQRTKMTGNGLFWRQPGGPILTKTGLGGAVIVDRIYFQGKHIAGWHSGGSLSFILQDALGGEHVVTNGSGVVCEDLDTLPFGAEIDYINNCDHSYKFAGMERDDQNSANLDYAMARYYNNRLGRFMTPDPPLMDQHIVDPQSWNLYSYVRNNPLSFVDPDGNDIELLCSGSAASKCAAERQKELQFLQKSLGNDKAASNLYINEVRDGDKTRYFVGIKGDVGEFMKNGETSHDLANLVQNKNIVQFGLTSNDLSRFGGAVTYEIGENEKNEHPQVFVNPDQANVANTVLNSSSVLGASRFGGQLQDPRWRVNPFTPGIMAWHEFGHVWGYINGRSLDRTNPEAFAWENRMREQLYGPIGPNNAPRVAH